VSSSNAGSILSSLHPADVTVDFQTCSNALRDLILVITNSATKKTEPFARFKVNFSGMFGGEARLSTDTDVLVGHFMNVVSSDLLEFYNFILNHKLSQNAWKSILDTLIENGDDVEFKRDALRIDDHIKENLVNTLNQVFSTNVSKLSGVAKAAKHLTILFIKCLATGIIPFIAQPLPDGTYDSDEVFSEDSKDVSSANLTQFPFFWSAMLDNRIIFKSTLITIKKVYPLSVVEIFKSFSKCNYLLQEILSAEFQDSNTNSFYAIDERFCNQFKTMERISDDKTAFEGFISYIVSAELIKIFNILAEDHEMHLSQWQNVYRNLLGGDDVDSKRVVLLFEDEVFKSLGTLLKKIFKYNADEKLRGLHNVSKLSQSISMLFLECLATESYPFISEPLNDGIYDTNEVINDHISRSQQSPIQFPSFWSARNLHGVIYKSNLVMISSTNQNSN
jgi:hypothetical protein